jgi:hypothetical protein
MRNHDLIGYFDCKHRDLSINGNSLASRSAWARRRIADQRAARVGLRLENRPQSLRQALERHRRCKQSVEDGISQQIEGGG